MKNSAIRLIFVLAILSAIGIIVGQVYWVKRAYDLEDKEFDYKVNSSLKNVALKVWELKKTQAPLYDVVDQVSSDYFIVQINHQVSAELLEHLLREQFELHNLITDFEFGQYDCAKDTVISKHYIRMSGSMVNYAPSINFPELSRENYYFGVFFPLRKKYISSELEIWVYSSIFLLGILVFMGYIVFTIMKQKRLREVQKDFVNNMTHEFKTPLASIQIAAEVLKKPNITQNPQRLLNYATIIDKEASLLALQVERVLQMAHAEKGEIQLRKEKTDIKKLVNDAVDNLSSLFEKHNAQVRKHFPEKELFLFVDNLHIKNAIGNLLENAVKYSGENAVIDIKVSEKDKNVRIDIKDNGPGIAPEYQKMIFSKFYRVPTGDIHDVKGFGLGLNYVQIICKAHKGDVSCHSKLGKGSTFSMFLPIN